MALIAYLASSPRPHTREHLAVLFYPDSENALTYLRRDLSEVRQVLDDNLLATQREVSLRTGERLWVDVLHFQTQLDLVAAHSHFPAQPCSDCLQALQTAIALYTDDFLAGFNLPDCPAFDEWRFFEMERLRQSLASALEKLIAWHEAQQQFEKAIAYGRRLVALDPLDEAAQRQLIRLYAASGQVSAALRQYDECVRLLDEELGLEPAPETSDLAQAVRARQLEPPHQRDQHDLLPQPAAPRTGNLPSFTTSFVGRTTETARLVEMISDPGCRLLVLHGPGGIGKTRLAVEAARQTAFSDGAWFVPLTGTSSTDSIISAIASALNLSLQGTEQPHQMLLNRLQGHNLLLVLDNFEHLLPDGAAFLTDLLKNAPQLKLLVTSRERLKVGAEWVFTLSGLEFPREQVAIDRPQAFGAIELFMQRSRQVQGDVLSGPEAIAAIARICRLTEGMPLALELAATWTATLSYTEIAAEIQRSLDFLTGTLRDLPDRHRSIRAVFDSSWEMLNQDERRLFRQLSIFRGGFTRAAVQEVCEPPAQHTILSLLASLEAKSFLKRSAAGRYEIHDLLRQYGAARLMQEPLAEHELRERQCRYYLSFCAAQEARLKGAEQLDALQEMTAEVANVRLAWRHAVRHGHARLLREAAEAIWLFLQQNNRTSFQEAARYFDLAINRLQELVTEPAVSRTDAEENELALAKLQALNAGAYLRLGQYEEALALLQKSLSRLRKLDASREIAFALNMQAATVHMQGDYRREHDYLQESISRARAAGDRWLAGYSLNDLGMATHLFGDTELAQQRSGESMALFRQLGDQRGLAFALDNLGLFAFHLGDYAEAEQLYREALSIREAHGDLWGVATALSHLAMIAQARGEVEAARTNLLQALNAAQEAGAKSRLLDTLVQLAALLDDEGDPEMAAALVHHCLQHPALSDAAREKAQALVARRQGHEGIAVAPPSTAPSLDSLVATLLAPLNM